MLNRLLNAKPGHLMLALFIMTVIVYAITPSETTCYIAFMAGAATLMSNVERIVDLLFDFVRR